MISRDIIPKANLKIRARSRNEIKKGNLYEKIPKKLSKELFNTIVLKNNCKIERIISMGHKTPKGKWYNQNKNEFVMILKGSAELLFFPDKKYPNDTKQEILHNDTKQEILHNDTKQEILHKGHKIKMKTGDYINIPAHLKHRVDKTSKKTIWLAVFY